ncbi:hypothetical protein L914_02854, partial [Phytophthora nicotianae]
MAVPTVSTESTIITGQPCCNATRNDRPGHFHRFVTAVTIPVQPHACSALLLPRAMDNRSVVILLNIGPCAP